MAGAVRAGAQTGAGIVYVLTTYDAERVAAWLASQGIDAVPYAGVMEDADRRAVEDRLARNEVEAVVATTALEMGYDKPDLTLFTRPLLEALRAPDLCRCGFGHG